jgi:dihydroorotase
VKVLIKKATILCKQSKFHLQQKDILIVNGIIQKISNNIIAEKKYTVIESTDLYISIGWMDTFADFADPGFEHKETIESGINAAVAGGYTDVLLIPNTQPTISNKTQVEYLLNKAKNNIAKVHVIGAISKNIEGESLAEMYDMHNSGAVAFSDGLHAIQSAGLLLKALQYVKSFDGVIIQQPIDKSLTKNGLMHEGLWSTKLGMPGMMDIAEHIIIQRDIEILKYTESKLHITGVSTAKGIDLIRKAKKEKLNITCGVTPYHLLLSENELVNYNSNYKVNPPLRSNADKKALLQAVADGTIDCIASHHNPQDWDAKNVEFEYATFGMMSLETTLHQLLSISNSTIEISTWIDLLTNNPRKIFGLPLQNIAEKIEANITVFSIKNTTSFTSESKKSKAINSPFLNTTLQGKVLATIHNNQLYIAK